jgi:hypothetical protein
MSTGLSGTLVQIFTAGIGSGRYKTVYKSMFVNFQVEKGRLAIDCPPEITKHLVDMAVGAHHTYVVLDV